MSRKVALTFDDGPHQELTAQVLHLLKERGKTATFFVIGQQAEAAPELLREMVAQGCEVGNHSYSHPGFDRISLAEMGSEIDRGSAVIQAATGICPAYFRSPYGTLSPQMMWALYRRRMLPIVLWSVSTPREYTKSPRQIVEEFSAAPLSPGDILLLHDPNRNSVAVLPQILDLLEERQLEAVSLEHLLGGAPGRPSFVPATRT